MTRTLTFFALGLAVTVAGCDHYLNEEAGAFLDQGDFGRATLNNQVEHTCRKLNAKNIGKYGDPLASNCPGRRQDGKYALFAYNETVQSATEATSGALAEESIAD